MTPTKKTVVRLIGRRLRYANIGGSKAKVHAYPTHRHSDSDRIETLCGREIHSAQFYTKQEVEKDRLCDFCLLHMYSSYRECLNEVDVEGPEA
jgi:hypothetical protein